MSHAANSTVSIKIIFDLLSYKPILNLALVDCILDLHTPKTVYSNYRSSILDSEFYFISAQGESFNITECIRWYMTKFARISEICWLSFGMFSQRFEVRYKKRSPTLPQVCSLSGAVPPVVGEGHMSASNRHKDGEQDPVKWEEDEGGFQEPPNRTDTT